MTAAAPPPPVRRLTPADLDRVVALEEAVTGPLPEGYVRRKPRAELRAYLDGSAGVAFGVPDGDVLVAVAMLRLPSPARPNTNLLPFPRVPPDDWPLRAAFLENTLVHPRRRGRGYQRLLLDHRVRYARAAGMAWLCAGVHLGNRVSWANLLWAGLAIVGIRFDPGHPLIGLLRGVAGRDVVTRPDDHLLVAAEDAAAHDAALRDGYVGRRQAPDGRVVYERWVD